MTDNNHPITPPPELLQQWAIEYWGNSGEIIGESEKFIAIQAARWGADMELEACCEWVEREIGLGREWCAELRATRRPKPPSLKEQALEAAQRFYANGHHDCSDDEIKGDFDIIRRALESLPD